MQDRYIAAVDLGTSKIALSVAKIEGKDIQVLYYKETPSAGIARGTIRNPKLVSERLQKLIKNANEELGIKILQVLVALPRYRIDQEQASAKVNRTDPDNYISAKEIKELVDVAMNDYVYEDSENREIYGVVPQSFAVEDQDIVSENDVIGVYSNFLEGHLTFYIGRKNSIKNITHTLNESNIALAKKVFVPKTTAGAILNEDEKESGVALIEIGAGVTSVTIYKGNRLKYYGSIPFGGNSITNDIVKVCKIPYKLAESIKIAYGSCTPNNLHTLSERILQINREDGSYKRFSVKQIAEIIEARCLEIINAVLYLIEESGFSQDIHRGVVLTGGASRLSGLKSLFSSISGYDVRIGFPSATKFRVEGATDATNLSAAASMGMVLESLKYDKLNCINEIEPIIEEEEEAEEQKVEVPETKSTEENLVSRGLFDEVVEPEPKERKKDNGEKKPAVHWDKMLKFTNKIGIGFEKFVDTTIGSIYNQMGDDQNG